VRLACVLLRATLAVIFIWHGLEKVSAPMSALGAAWAQRLWEQRNEPPRDVLVKLEKMETVEPRAWLNDESLARWQVSQVSGNPPATWSGFFAD